MFLSEWREFPSAPCLTGNLLTARVSMLLKSRASVTLRRVRVKFIAGEEQSECVFVALGIQHPMRMCRTVMALAMENQDILSTINVAWAGPGSNPNLQC